MVTMEQNLVHEQTRQGGTDRLDKQRRKISDLASMQLKIGSQTRLFWAFGVWILAAGTGSALLWKHALTPAPLPRLPPVLPSVPGLETHAAGLPTLLVFLHPLCPCSEASFSELLKVARAAQGRARILVLMYEPEAKPVDWKDSKLARRVRASQEVHWMEDTTGRIAAQFGVEASGTAVLYDKEGALVYGGGLTWARGHEGENAGVDAMIEFIVKGKTSLRARPVFGCKILAD